MELRVLCYFLAAAREESICGAAESPHLSQPTLSRHLIGLETELGKKLFVRGNCRITLTEDGVLLRKRAGEILDLVEDGLGYALCLDGIINTSGDSALCFRPLHPPVRAGMSVVWKKYQVFSGASEKFLELLRQTEEEAE